MKMCRLKPDLKAFQNSIKSFAGSFLIFDSAEDCYKISHSSVETSLFLVLGDICDIDELVRNCAYNILQYLSTRNCPPSEMKRLEIAEKNFACVSEKIISLIGEHISVVYACLAELFLWNDETFCRKFENIISNHGGDFLFYIDEESKSMIVHFAAAGNVKWVEYIYEFSKEKEFSEQHYLSLNAACEHNQLNVVKYLLSVKVKPDIKSVFHAVKGGTFEIIKILADNGVDMNERTYSLTRRWKAKSDTITVLHESCLGRQAHLVLDLLNLCPALLKTKNESGEYSLLSVAYSGDVETLKILIEKGQDPFGKSNIDSTILHFACQGGNQETFQYIVKTYPELLNPEHDNSTQGTLLHRAAEGGIVSQIETLADLKKDIYCRTTDGKTLLHRACRNGHLDVCRYLVNTYSQLLPILDSEGMSPIHEAGFGGNMKILELLSSKSLESDVKTLSNDGKTFCITLV